MLSNLLSMDVNLKPEIRFYFCGNRFELFCHFRQGNYIKNSKRQVKLIPICLILRVYNVSHQTVKCGHQRKQILQELAGLETYISMKIVKPVCQKELVLASLLLSGSAIESGGQSRIAVSVPLSNDQARVNGGVAQCA